MPVFRYAAEGYARAKGLAALVTTFSVGGLSVRQGAGGLQAPTVSRLGGFGGCCRQGTLPATLWLIIEGHQSLPATRARSSRPFGVLSTAVRRR